MHYLWILWKNKKEPGRALSGDEVVVRGGRCGDFNILQKELRLSLE